MNIAAQNTWLASKLVQGGKGIDLSVSGTFVATVTLQRSTDDTNWFDIATYTTPTEVSNHVSASAMYYRAGVATGNYTSGTAVVNLYP